MSEKRFDCVVDEPRNVLCYTTTENVVAWLKEHPKIREGFWVRVGDASDYVPVQDYLRDQDEENTVYEVWSLANGDFLEFTSDDPIRICHWLRQIPRDKRHFNVHPRGPGYHRDKVNSYEFIRKHEEALLDDIIRTAFEKGSPDGVAKDIIDLFYSQ